MSQIESIYYKDIAEKKRIAKSVFSKKTHNGKAGCRLPSESLSTKERAALNGPVVSYNLSKPMTWDEFRSMPRDLQQRYVSTLQDAYNARDNMLAKMFGVSPGTVFECRHKLGIAARPGKVSKKDWANWFAFLASEGVGMSVDGVVDAEKVQTESEIPSENVQTESEIPPENVQTPAELPTVTWDDLFLAAKLLGQRFGVTIKIEVGT